MTAPCGLGGGNWSGQLGDGTTSNKSSPIQVGTDTDWTGIASGGSFTVALKKNGTIWAWGDNEKGQLGDGTTTSRSSPAQVGTDTNWVDITTGVRHSLALKSDGTLWAWGGNNLGQLATSHSDSCGPGKFCSKTPIQVGSDTNWADVEAIAYFSVALKSDGTLWVLGTGDSNKIIPPVQIGADSDWVATAGIIMLKSDGTLWSWGNDLQSSSGDNEMYSVSFPVQIGADSNWVAAAVGDHHRMALKSNGTLWGWGRNSSGQLGDGTAWKDTPTQVQ